MRKHQKQITQKIPLECPCCRLLFEFAACQLTAGKQILCPNCDNLFVCRSRELFAALKHIHKLLI